MFRNFIVIFAIWKIQTTFFIKLISEAVGLDHPFRNMTENDLLQLVNNANIDLRFFIYPMPTRTYLSNKDSLLLSHFRLEHKFIEYLQINHALNIKINNSAFKPFLVSDPEEANVFIIEHRQLKLSSLGGGECDNLLHKHLAVIVDNVIFNYPYYNRSNGWNHFYMAMYGNILNYYKK